MTINADQHALMRNFHKPGDEKRMVVVLREGTYQDWLEAPLSRVGGFLVAYSADSMMATVPPVL